MILLHGNHIKEIGVNMIVILMNQKIGLVDKNVNIHGNVKVLERAHVENITKQMDGAMEIAYVHNWVR